LGLVWCGWPGPKKLKETLGDIQSSAPMKEAPDGVQGPTSKTFLES
jgi:hypothetical protein